MLSQLGKLGEVNAQFDLVEDVVGSCTGVLSFLSAGLLYYAEGDTLVDSKLTGKFIKLLFEELHQLLSIFLAVFEHLCAPILINDAQVLQIKLLNHQNGKSIVSILEKHLDHILCLVLLQLLEGDSACEVRRVSHLGQNDGVFNQVYVLIWIKL